MSAGAGDSSIGAELLRFGLYKPSQGRLVRQLTFFAVVVIAAFGCVTLSNGLLSQSGDAVRVGVPVLVGCVVAWIAFRAVNFPRFADFLIAVESEIEKITWPSRREVIQAAIVVLVTMVFFGAFLTSVDYIWRWFFRLIRFLEVNA